MSGKDFPIEYNQKYTRGCNQLTIHRKELQGLFLDISRNFYQSDKNHPAIHIMEHCINAMERNPKTNIDDIIRMLISYLGDSYRNVLQAHMKYVERCIPPTKENK